MDAANIVFQSLFLSQNNWQLYVSVIWDQDIEGPKVAERDVVVFGIIWYDFLWFHGLWYFLVWFLWYSLLWALFSVVFYFSTATHPLPCCLVKSAQAGRKDVASRPFYSNYQAATIPFSLNDTKGRVPKKSVKSLVICQTPPLPQIL